MQTCLQSCAHVCSMPGRAVSLGERIVLRGVGWCQHKVTWMGLRGPSRDRHKLTYPQFCFRVGLHVSIGYWIQIIKEKRILSQFWGEMKQSSSFAPDTFYHLHEILKGAQKRKCLNSNSSALPWVALALRGICDVAWNLMTYRVILSSLFVSRVYVLSLAAGTVSFSSFFFFAQYANIVPLTKQVFNK